MIKALAFKFVSAFESVIPDKKHYPHVFDDEADSLYPEARNAQDQQEIINHEKRRIERIAKCVEWVKPENVLARLDELKQREQEEKEWEEKHGPRFAPIPDEIPKEMRGQQPSTIRLMLEEAGWKYDWEEMKWFQN